jgi:glucuronoarabinoxylan endo-1,4-beta-xylanase
VDIYAVSIQNEPDIQVPYESCDWTASDITAFIRDYGDLIESKIAAPESFNFNQVYTSALLNDEEAVANLDIVAGHIYGGGLAPFPLAEEKGKEIWMTEYLMNQNATDQWDQLSDEVIWDESLEMLRTVHEAMVNNWNAYVWWYLKRYYSFLGDGTEGTTSGEILKRGYAFSHFSKFVRPGYVRVDASLEESDALITAYQGDDKTVIVLINLSSSSVANISLSVTGSSPLSATVYSTTLLLDRRITQITPDAEGRLLINLLGKSITTVIIEN